MKPTPEIANVPVHEEIAFFEPLLDSTRKLLDVLEQTAHSRETAELDCNYVPARGKQRAWKEVYLIVNEWQFFRHYFMGKSPLYYYWEPPMQGLVNKESALWVMANAKYLKELTLREEFKVNEFAPNTVKKMPFQNIEYHFQRELARMLTDESKVYSLRAQECEKFLKLASAYLPKKKVVLTHRLVRVLLKVGLHQEIQKLQTILAGGVLTDPAALKKRMRAVHSVAMKYYFTRAGEEQKRKIDSLVGKDKGYQGQALKYVQRIVARSFNAPASK